MTIFRMAGNGMGTSAAPILFLDFDGVTHPDPCDKERLFESLPLLESVLRSFPDVQVVLSTTWRQNYPIGELRDLFSNDIVARVIGGTPAISDYDRDWYPVALSERPRQREVEAWLHQNRTLAHPWVAIDDRPLWFNTECPNLLVTDRTIGFTESNADQLQQMILERLP